MIHSCPVTINTNCSHFDSSFGSTVFFTRKILSDMRMQNYVADHVRSNAGAFGSYKPAVQVGMQPPTAYHMGEGMPTYTHLVQPATAPCMNESTLLNGRLPPTTLLTSMKPSNLQNADKKSCAEEGWLDDDKSGAEDKGPSEDYTFFGVDLKPVLPVALAVSTVIGGLCMLLVQIPMLSRFTTLSQVWLSAPFAVVYGIVLGCMAYCAFADPGQIKKTRSTKSGPVAGMDIEEGVLRRAHKSWQYSRPIRRYDHYCKWLQNVIGLLNHREFVIMVGGLLLIGVLGIMVDIWLAILIAEKGFLQFEIVAALHLGYSVALLAIDGPIFKIHFGLISRNEMAQEWKKNEHYVASNTSIGDNVPVEDLEDDEYNELFDRNAFVYDRTRNPFDNGCFTNCLNFWCQPRWTSDAKGEFWAGKGQNLLKIRVVLPTNKDYCIISHCNDPYEGFTAVTKRSGIDGRRSKWLKGKKNQLDLQAHSRLCWIE